MHPQLQAVADDFRAASARLQVLVGRTPAMLWPRRAHPERWSMGECVAHINLTSGAFVPLLQRAVEEGRKLPLAEGSTRFRRDLTGWLLWKTVSPPVRFRMRTTAAFIPGSMASVEALVAEFDNWQQMQLRWVEAADGLQLARIQVVSPFNAKVRYSLYSCLTILPRHQHRHIWQAEQVAAALQS